jgi:hypothetical protein
MTLVYQIKRNHQQLVVNQLQHLVNINSQNPLYISLFYTDIIMANDDITEDNAKNVSPSASKKRGAPASATNATKKPKGKASITSVDDVDSGVAAVGINESEPIETPPKKARTSAVKKTPEPPSEEYVRKLRPRK